MESFEFYSFATRLSTVYAILFVGKQPEIRGHTAGLSLIAPM
jgi:hypothetical protein